MQQCLSTSDNNLTTFSNQQDSSFEATFFYSFIVRVWFVFDSAFWASWGQSANGSGTSSVILGHHLTPSRPSLRGYGPLNLVSSPVFPERPYPFVCLTATLLVFPLSFIVINSLLRSSRSKWWGCAGHYTWTISGSKCINHSETKVFHSVPHLLSR